MVKASLLALGKLVAPLAVPCRQCLFAFVFLTCCSASGPSRAADAVQPLFKPVANAQFQFAGVLGQRITANVDNWLLRVPTANPGMIEMFHLRDRKPEPKIVPWAGAFVGNYLI